VITRYGFGVHNDFRAVNVRYELNGTTFELEARGRTFLVRLPLIGDFNVYNALAALGIAHGMGLNLARKR
jgi:UDP-N-acetylmuramoyl-L-alanyl-D-glutamate--2,6-diaminopimelate ligase